MNRFFLGDAGGFSESAAFFDSVSDVPKAPVFVGYAAKLRCKGRRS
jgi:hypothetical protein